MAISVLQEVGQAVNTTAATSFTSGTFGSNCTVGSYIECYIFWSSSTLPNGSPAVQDSAGQSYTQRQQQTNSGGNGWSAALYTFDSNASATKLSVTVKWSSSQNDCGIWLREIGQVNTRQSTFSANMPSGSGSANGLTTNVTPSAQPGLVSGIIVDISQGAASPTAGTSPISFTQGIQTWTSGGVNVGVSQSNRFTSVAQFAFNGSDTTDNGDFFGLLGALYTEQVPGPTITAQPQSVTQCAGTTATFTVSATGSGALSYQWNLNGSNVGTNSSSYTTSTLAWSDNGDVVYCAVTDSNGTTNSANAIITVLICPPVMWFKA